jgi:hypothetical protein
MSNDSSDGCFTAFSDKCSEHAYFGMTLRETRQTQLAEVAEAREWRDHTTDKLNKIELSIAAHVAEEKGVAMAMADVTGEAEIVRKRNWTKLKWAVGVALAAAPGIWVVLREMWS